MRLINAVVFLLSVACCCAAQPEVQPQHHFNRGRQPSREGIVTPSDFVKAWGSRQQPDYISPCLAISISYIRDYNYAPGFDLQWFSGYRTIRQFLKWNKEFDGSDPSRPRANLTIYIAGAQGFVNGANDTGMLLRVWDQCAIEAHIKMQRQVPGPAYFADYTMSKYGIEVPDQVLRQVVFDYWPAVNNELYGAKCDRGCLGSISDWSKLPADACGCNPTLVAELKRFSAFDPSKSTSTNPTPTTKQCLQQLTAGSSSSAITIYSFRAALNFCFNALALQTGNGLGWRPATGDGYKPGFFELLSFPEFVMPNFAVRQMRFTGGMQELSALG